MKFVREKYLRFWVFIEVFLCFVSVTLMLLTFSVFTIPLGVFAIFSLQLGAILVFIITLAGWCGVFAIVSLSIKIFEKKKPLKPSILILCGIIMGITALSINHRISGMQDLSDHIQYFWLPLLASLHLSWVGREYLFGQAANK